MQAVTSNDKYYELTQGPYAGIVTRSHNGKWYVYGGSTWVRAIEPQSLYGCRNGEWYSKYRKLKQDDATRLIKARQSKMERLAEFSQVLAKKAYGTRHDVDGRTALSRHVRVAKRMNTLDGVIVALLDGITLCGVTDDALSRAGFPTNVISSIEAITKRDGEAYDEYVSRVNANPLARSVKIMQLHDVLDARNRIVTDGDADRLAQCCEMLAYLERGAKQK